jgi:hypothetical protein
LGGFIPLFPKGIFIESNSLKLTMSVPWIETKIGPCRREKGGH